MSVMAPEGQQLQLTLNIKHDPGVFIVGSLKLSGSFLVKRDLNDDDRLRVTIVDDRGEIVAEAPAVVNNVALPRKEKDGMKWTERAHVAKVVA